MSAVTWGWIHPPSAWEIKTNAHKCAKHGHNPVTEGSVTICLECGQAEVYGVHTVLPLTEPDVPVDSIAVFRGPTTGSPGWSRKQPDGSWNGGPWEAHTAVHGAPVAIIAAIRVGGDGDDLHQVWRRP